jgi:hypothetical protein
MYPINRFKNSAKVMYERLPPKVAGQVGFSAMLINKKAS